MTGTPPCVRPWKLHAPFEEKERARGEHYVYFTQNININIINIIIIIITL